MNPVSGVNFTQPCSVKYVVQSAYIRIGAYVPSFDARSCAAREATPSVTHHTSSACTVRRIF